MKFIKLTEIEPNGIETPIVLNIDIIRDARSVPLGTMLEVSGPKIIVVKESFFDIKMVLFDKGLLCEI